MVIGRRNAWRLIRAGNRISASYADQLIICMLLQWLPCLIRAGKGLFDCSPAFLIPLPVASACTLHSSFSGFRTCSIPLPVTSPARFTPRSVAFAPRQFLCRGLPARRSFPEAHLRGSRCRSFWSRLVQLLPPRTKSPTRQSATKGKKPFLQQIESFCDSHGIPLSCKPRLCVQIFGPGQIPPKFMFLKPNPLSI